MKYLNLFWLLLLCICCGECTQTDTKNVTNSNQPNTIETSNNVIILLDLSSRVKLQNQVSKDTDAIKSALASFQNLQNKRAFMTSKDRLSIVLAYQSSAIYDAFNLGKVNFSIDMHNKVGQAMNKPIFDQKRTDMEMAVAELYSKAVKSPTSGADIWGFFCNEWNNYYQDSMKNKVIILTDGYLQFDNSITSKRPKGTYMTGFDKLRNKTNWEKSFNAFKLNKCPAAINNTEVLILEVAPNNKAINTNEFQIIQKFWETWFGDMNVPVDIYESDNIGGNPNRIEAFLKRP